MFIADGNSTLNTYCLKATCNTTQTDPRTQLQRPANLSLYRPPSCERLHSHVCASVHDRACAQLQCTGSAHLAAAGGSVLRQRGALGFSHDRACRPTPTALALAGLDVGPCLRAPCAPWRQHGGPDWRLGPCLLPLPVPANHLGQEQRAAAQLDVGRRLGFRHSGGRSGRGLVWAQGGLPL